MLVTTLQVLLPSLLALRAVLAQGDPRGVRVACAGAAWAVLELAPACVRVCSRRAYERVRGCLWAMSEAAAGAVCVAALHHQAGTQHLWAHTVGAVFSRPVWYALLLCTFKPWLLCLGSWQVLATVGQLLHSYWVLTLAGDGGGPGVGACAALAAASLAVSYAQEWQLRRQWLRL